MSIEGDSSNPPLLTFPLELAALNTKGTKPGNKASTGNDLKKKKTHSVMCKLFSTQTTESSFNNIQSGLSLQ